MEKIVAIEDHILTTLSLHSNFLPLFFHGLESVLDGLKITDDFGLDCSLMLCYVEGLENKVRDVNETDYWQRGLQTELLAGKYEMFLNG